MRRNPNCSSSNRGEPDCCLCFLRRLRWPEAAWLSPSDGALRLVAELRGDHVARSIQLHMVYAPEPPFDSGTPETAPPEILQRARDSFADITAQREATARNIAAKLGISFETAATL